jgi:hypothetical protein
MDHVRDNLEAMILLEKKFYHCEDYLETDQPEPTYSPLHAVAEMANLVTDIQFLDMNPLFASSSKEGGSHKNNKSVSPAGSVHDLYAMQMSRRRFTHELSMLSAWRHQMYSWTRIVISGLHLDRDTVAVAFSTLDRFLTIKMRDNDEISREDFQLYCMVSLYISAKTGASIRKLRLTSVVKISQGLFQAEQITAAELEILKALQWHVNPPTVMAFCKLYFYLYASEVPHRVYASCENLADLALADEFFISKAPSVIALCVVLLATQQTGMPLAESHGFLKNLQGLVRVQGDTFDSVFQRLECLC